MVLGSTGKAIAAAHGGPIWLILLDWIGGRTFLATAELGVGARLRGWDPITGERLWSSSDDTLINYNGYGLAVAHVSADAPLIAAATDNGVYRWDAATGRLVEDCDDLHPCVIWSVAAAVLPDGRAILVGAGHDHQVYRWDAASGELLGPPLSGHKNCVKAVAVVPLASGQSLIVSGDENETWRRWDAATGEEIGDPLSGGDARRYAHAVASTVLADGRTLLACMNTGGVTRLWDADTGAPIAAPLHADFSPISLSVARIGGEALVIATSDDEEILAWNVATGEQLRPSLRGLSAAVTSAAHDPAILAVGTRAGAIVIEEIGDTLAISGGLK